MSAPTTVSGDEAAEAVEAITEGAGQARVLAAADPGPEGHPRLGPRLRRRCRAPRRARVGREGADALADHPGGRQDRPLRLRRAWPSSSPTPPGSGCRSSTRSCSGATPASACRSWAPRSPSLRSSARARGEQIGEWIPRCFGTADDVKVAAFCASEPNAGSDVSGAAHEREVRRGGRRVGPQRPEGVGHERRHRRRARRDRLRRSRARLQRPRGVRVPMSEAKGIDQGAKVSKHGLRASHTADVHPRRLPHPRRLRARRQGEARRAPRAGARGQEEQLPGRDADLRGLAPDGRRAGARDRARGL